MSLPEEDLIKSRPLLFESRPFSRIPKRTSLPPSTTHTLIDTDFLPFLSSLSRLQLLFTTASREITRYQESASSITHLTTLARTTLQTLHADLAAAQAQKTHRLEYDQIAESFLGSTKERGETEGAIRKLREEIEELEREGREYAVVWEQRKEAFEGIVGQLEMMWSQIKEEKEEHERREGMSEGEEGEGDADGDADTEKDGAEDGEVRDEEQEEGELGDVRMEDGGDKDGGRDRDVDRMDTS